MSKVLIVSAGLMGAGGIVLAAAGAHAKAGAGLDSAAYMLLFHALAVLAALALLDQDRLWRPVAMIALGGWVFGSVLFSVDIALRAFAAQRLFAMAAPIGGSTLILAWLALALAALKAPIYSKESMPSRHARQPSHANPQSADS